MNLEVLSYRLRKINDNITNINAGGCGEFALALGRHLTSNDIKFKYVLISYAKNETLLSSTRNFNNLPEDIKTNMCELEGLSYGVSHVMLYYKGHFIDSTGVYKELSDTKWGRNMFRPSTIISENYLSAWCADGNWNDMFNRKNIPKIQKEIKKINVKNLRKSKYSFIFA